MYILTYMQIYIKQELEQKLRQASKDTDVPMSQLLAEALEAYFGPEEIKMAYDPVKKEVAGKPIKKVLMTTPRVVKGSDFVPKPPDPETGYPCCVKGKPCRHWQWDGVKSAYLNELTGKEREVL